MTGLPEFKTRLRIWPAPGRRVQDGTNTLDAAGGGRWLPNAGRIVEWSPFLLEQYRAGDIILHAPPCEKHAFEQGDDECRRCGRNQKDAEQYNVHAAGPSKEMEPLPESPTKVWQVEAPEVPHDDHHE